MKFMPIFDAIAFGMTIRFCVSIHLRLPGDERHEDAHDAAGVNDDGVDDAKVAADKDREHEVEDGRFDRVHVEAGGGSVVENILRLSSIRNTNDFVDILGVTRQSCS